MVWPLLVYEAAGLFLAVTCVMLVSSLARALGRRAPAWYGAAFLVAGLGSLMHLAGALALPLPADPALTAWVETTETITHPLFALLLAAGVWQHLAPRAMMIWVRPFGAGAMAVGLAALAGTAGLALGGARLAVIAPAAHLFAAGVFVAAVVWLHRRRAGEPDPACLRDARRQVGPRLLLPVLLAGVAVELANAGAGAFAWPLPGLRPVLYAIAAYVLFREARRHRLLTFRLRISLAFIGTIAMPLLLAVYFFAHAAHERSTSALATEAEGHTRVLASIVEHELAGYAQRPHDFAPRVAALVADAPSRRLLLAAGAGREWTETDAAAGLRAYFRRTLAADPDLLQLRFLSDSGRELVRVERLADGSLRAAPRQALQDKSEEPYVPAGLRLKAGEHWISPINLNREHGRVEAPHRPVARIVYAIHARDGTRLGLAVKNVDARTLFVGVRRIVLHGKLLFFDQDGSFLDHPDPTIPWHADLGHGRTFAALHPELAQALAQGETSHFLDRGTGIFYAWHTVYPNPADRRRHIVLMECIPREVMFAPQEQALRRDLLAYFLLAAAGLLGFLWLAGRLLRPLHKLVAVTERVQQGDLEQRARIESRDELGTLGESFDRMLDALGQSQRRQKFLSESLNAASDMVLIADPDSRIRYVNKAFLDQTGYREDELLGRPVRDIKSGLNDEALYRDLWQTITAGRPWRGELINRRKDGSTYHEEQTITPIAGEDGRVQHYVAVKRDITERKAVESRMQFLAEHDPLTRLHNRHYLQPMLASVAARVKRGGRPGALLFMDLDNFKYVNDTFGHGAGDRLLTELSQHLSQRLRGSDVLARFGGDEFILLLQDVDDAKAAYVAEGYRRHIEQFVFHEGQQTFPIGVSIGVVLITPTNAEPEGLIAQADMGCHIAKREGRNRVHVVTETSDERADMSAGMGWHRRIRMALEQDRFRLLYQPIVDVKSGAIACHEALLRMLDEPDKEIPPGTFLPFAERFGLMIDIDRWVVVHAIGALARTGAGGCLAVNLSGRAFGDDALLAVIRDGIAAAQIEPARLIFEVTETEAIASLAKAGEFLVRFPRSAAARRSTISARG